MSIQDEAREACDGHGQDESADQWGGDLPGRLAGPRALIAALLVGLVDTFGKVLLPSVSGMLVYMLMALSAEKALSLGLINRVVDAETADAQALEWARDKTLKFKLESLA